MLPNGDAVFLTGCSTLVGSGDPNGLDGPLLDVGEPKGETGSFPRENFFGAVPNGELAFLKVGSPTFDFGVGDPKLAGGPFGGEAPNEGADFP
mmetsp:Transcript_1281/g.2638  ORF Transcript_1281/g.2638 Transcript_1281/m.2638 type:complete len:93 (+) Transcript_1281:908-1186(+)